MGVISNLSPQQQAIADSGYEGWVAWLGGIPVRDQAGILRGYDNQTPIYEAVPHIVRRSLVAGSVERDVRGSNRTTMLWDEVPHRNITCLELYGFRSTWDQPIFTCLAQPGRRMRWVQYKHGALVAQTLAGGDPRETEQGHGQQRTGVTAWTVGFWDQTAGHAKIWTFHRNGGVSDIMELEGSNHLCWPKPLGFGLNPKVIGLTDDDVPPIPKEYSKAGLVDLSLSSAQIVGGH